MKIVNMFDTELDFEVGKEYIYSCVGKGWHSILDKLFEQFSDEPIVILQVKEKFGGLRIYFMSENDDDFDFDYDAAYEMIDSLCYEAWSICEYCGKPGEVRTNLFWVKTLCDECDEERVQKYNSDISPRLVELMKEIQENNEKG